MIYMAKSAYQPTKDKQLADAQEVLYSKDFKKADIAGGFQEEVKQNDNQ